MRSETGLASMIPWFFARIERDAGRNLERYGGNFISKKITEDNEIDWVGKK